MLRRFLAPVALALASAAVILAACLIAAGNGWIPTAPTAAQGRMADAMPGMETSPAASTAVRPFAGTVVAALDTEQDLGRMAAVMRVTGLARSLEGTGPFTVFAPTDEAFEAMKAPTYLELLGPENVPRLSAVLRAHVVPGSHPPAELGASGTLRTSAGTDIAVEASGTEMVIAGRGIVTERIRAANGWVYRVDKVLVP